MDEKFTISVEIDLNDVRGSLNNLRTELNRAVEPSRQLDGFDRQLGKLDGSFDKAAKSAQSAQQSLSTTRYALYDVSQTATIAGVALLGLATATYAVGIAYERDFANVIRTSSPDIRNSVEAIGELRNNLIDLTGRIPLAFGQVAEIATLGNQLGISSDKLVEFTEIVAKFSATSGLSIDETATAFGRLTALLPELSSGAISLEAFASGVLKVGVNSVATEGQILKISTQLASIADYGGLSASALIGVSAALASVGTQPELARGTITRLFTLFGRAVASSGDDLDGFAKVAGVSAEEFKSAFSRGEMDPIFLGFVNGLGNIQRSGGDVVATLNELGISSVRDVPSLTRLAQAADSAGNAGRLLNQTYADAATGIREASEVADQYGIIQSTVAAQLQLVANNFQNLLASISGGGGVFGGLLENLNELLRTLTDFAQDPTANFFLQTGIILAGLTGIVLIAAGALTRFAANAIAVQQAFAGMTAGGAAATATMARLTIAARAFGVAATVVAGLVFLPDLTEQGRDFVDQLRGIERDLESSTQRIADFQRTGTTGITRSGVELLPSARGNSGLQELRSDIEAIDSALTSLASANELESLGTSLEYVSSQLGISQQELLTYLPELTTEMRNQGIEFNKTKDGANALNKELSPLATQQEIAAKAAEEQAAAQEDLAFQLGFTGEAYESAAKELEEYQNRVATASAGFVDFGTILTGLANESKSTAEKLARDSEDPFDTYMDYYNQSGVTIDNFIIKLDEQIAAQSAWADDIAELTARGAGAFASQLAALGPEGAELAAQAVNLTAEQLGQLEDRARLAAFLGSQAFAEGFAQNNAQLVKVYQEGGIEAVRGLIQAQRQEADGTIPGAVAAFVAKWNSTYSANPISMPVGANTDPAQAALDRFVLNANGRRVRVAIDGSFNPGGGPIRAFATGGNVSGPGTGTSDSIPAWLSNGEYVMRAAAVRKYGTGLMDAINRGSAPRFASGGQVGSGTASPASLGGVVELGPKSLARLGREVTNNIMVDDVSIANAANRGNVKLGRMGTR